MPWLSRSPSPRVSSRAGSPSNASPPSVVYIPPLVDGACGTALRAQQSALRLLRDDASAMMRMMPRMSRALWTEFVASGGTMSWADRMDILIHIALVAIELYMLVAVLPLWFALPGILFCTWFCGCAGLVLALSWKLNVKHHVDRCSAGTAGWMMGQETDDERWIVIEGMGISSRHFCNSTIPTLSKLFGRTMTGICMPSYGVPADLVSLLLHRCIPLPSRPTRTIHSQLRAALLDSSVGRVVVLAHNTGAAALAQATAHLYADVPADRLAKLEIYTFGAAASEFVIPTGESNNNRGSSGSSASSKDASSPPTSPSPPPQQQLHHHQTDAHAERARGQPHIEHFALAADPLARLGVLHGVRQDLRGRYCGAVFVIDGASLPMQQRPSTSAQGQKKQKQKQRQSPSGLRMADYLEAMFPAQMMKGGAAGRGALDSIMAIDRDVAEKREFAALSSYAAATNPRGSAAAGGKRLSWTALGATAGAANGTTTATANGNGGVNGQNGVRKGGSGSSVMDGVMGLEMARRGCKDCDGHRGREVSWLVRYVNIGFCVGANGVAADDDAGRAQ